MEKEEKRVYHVYFFIKWKVKGSTLKRDFTDLSIFIKSGMYLFCYNTGISALESAQDQGLLFKTKDVIS